MPDCADFLKRKLDHIRKDYETAYSSFERHNSQIMHIRGWSITVVIAYLGFAKSISMSLSISLAFPVFVAVLGFYILEAFQLMYCLVNGLNIRQIDRIFSIENDAEFHNTVRKYVFRNLELKNMQTMDKIKKLRCAMYSKETILWYLFLIIGCGVIIAVF